MATIQSVKARQIFDSRGNPTVEVDVILSNGDLARAVVPSGASTALELRDGSSEYRGKGVSKAVNKVNSIIGPALVGKGFFLKDPSDQTAIDAFMVQQLDGTQNEWGWCKQKHIANITGNKKLVLPIPAFNVINGGSHAGNKLAMQQFMILPVGASSFKESMKMGCEVYHHLKADVDGNGLLDYGEFVAVIIHLQRMENDEHFHRAFLFFDKDGNGYIDLDELREALALITLYDSYSINKEKVFHFNSCNVIFCLRN